MAFDNRYYVTEAPFRVFRHVGHAASNAWVGGSRVVNTVMEATNARAGDVLHVLVGGTFLASGDEVHEVSLSAPKHVFERGGGPRDSELAEALSRDGRLRQSPKPTGPVDYAAVRNRDVEYPDHTGVVAVEPLQFSISRVSRPTGAPRRGTSAG